ncbi:MAG: lysophospholipase [Candidatus Thiodiazotropha sp. (ex Lucina aurantia)]|nr:lysophospholipase [Candidatus Thiodiazotropha sp. (ex Lucina pensylvanica)]MBT3023268.1 lysophospholipase [Candidatus Thiodiazotropha taylori]MBV2100670.1 lysophospholipase [Candidatus Thiodiazotropha sp. (ex Codakia orbicularis)]MBV2103045.1 lysophospholipase [Candidatus Thiodiazotropha sp. (ex Lucina aurantia)]MBV2117788.1 lysophospholipase [Candidatus Thiodiazotropha sp. (ex Lucina aurantia)]
MKLQVILFFSLIYVVSTAEADGREKTVCGSIQEPFLFWLWSSAAPNPDKNRALVSPLIEQTQFTTSDNKILRGYKYKSHYREEKRIPPKGYVLMALGNAMIADQIITSLKYLASNGYDVYIFDYRGYGNSEGKRRINAIIEDYKEIITFLNSKYDKRFLYGISLGGAVIMNAIGSGAEYDSAIIDSSPSRFSDYGCPETIDPVNNLPHDASKIFIITGKKDQVLGSDMTSPLRIEAQQRGARVLDGDDFSHPYMDRDLIAHKARTKLILDFFTQAPDRFE